MRNAIKLSLNMINVEQLTDVDKAKLKGGGFAVEFGCPPPVALPKQEDAK